MEAEYLMKNLPYLNLNIFRTKNGITVTYPGRLGAQYAGLGTLTLAPKKGFLTFYLKVFFKHPQRRVFQLHNLENALQRNLRTGTARECIFRNLKISAKHGGGKGQGELEDVTGLPRKTLDMSLYKQSCKKY